MSPLKSRFAQVFVVLAGCCVVVASIASIIFLVGTNETLKGFFEIATWVSLVLSLLGGMIICGGLRGQASVSHSIDLGLDENVREEIRRSRSMGDKLGLAIALSFGAVSFVCYRILQSIS